MAYDVATNTYDLTEVVPLFPEAYAPLRLPVVLAASTSYPKGTILGKITASGKFAPYASGNSDGSQTPLAIIPRTCTTDASSNVTFGTGSTGGQFGETFLTASVYFKGAFACGDLVGLDANAAGVAAFGKVIVGNTTTGTFLVH